MSKIILVLLLLTCCGCSALRVNRQNKVSSSRETLASFSASPEDTEGFAIGGGGGFATSGEILFSGSSSSLGGVTIGGSTIIDCIGDCGPYSAPWHNEWIGSPQVQIEEFNYGVH